MNEPKRFGTLLVRHEHVDPGEPVGLPIVRASTFAFPDAAAHDRFLAGDASQRIYSRYGNPTVEAVEQKIAALEGAEECLAFGSGLAAVSTTALGLLQAGEELVCSEAIYGGSYRFFRDLLPRWGIRVRFVPLEALADPANLSDATKLLYVESPVNPTLRILDVAKIAAVAQARGIPLVVDATFATPILFRPLEHGATISLHSATKYLNGHSDLLAGVVSGSAKALARIERTRRALGGVLDAQAAYELHRGLATLEVRVRRQEQTARTLAELLASHPAVSRVLHPSRPDHPDHALAARLMPEGTGGVLTIALTGQGAAARRVYDRLQLFRRAASLGGVESLAALPMLSSHAGYSEAELARAGVEPGMIRLSVGLEDPRDLAADLTAALDQEQAGNSKT